MLEAVQPIVLVGGASRRFGRDKLREPVGAGWLVDRPIAALREVFGPRVAAVGDCGADVAARADRHIADRYPGKGPLGGVVAAMEEFAADVFVLPGDVPAITAQVVRAILCAAANDLSAWAVIAGADRPEPCIGIYRLAGLETLKGRLVGRLALIDAIPGERKTLVCVNPAVVANANTPADLRASYGAGGPSTGR